MKKLVFDVEEYGTRVRKVKERMDAAGIEVMLVADTANINYLTGYDGWSFYVHQGVLVSLEADEPVWYGRQQLCKLGKNSQIACRDSLRSSGSPDM